MRLTIPFFLSCLVPIVACDDGFSDPEPDSSTIVDERPIDLSIVSSTSFGALEVDGTLWAAFGQDFVRVPAASEPVTVMSATRIHGGLAHDETFVYFATQSERFGSHPRESGPMVVGGHLDDGAIYRVRRDGTGDPEKLVEVGVLVGPISVESGHLYVCESPGLNANGNRLDVTLGEEPSNRRLGLRFNEYCEGVIATEQHLLMAMTTRAKAEVVNGRPIDYPDVIELARADRTSAMPWDDETGPERIATTSSETLEAMHRASPRARAPRATSRSARSAAKPFADTAGATSGGAGGAGGAVAPTFTLSRGVLAGAADSAVTGTPDGSGLGARSGGAAGAASAMDACGAGAPS